MCCSARANICTPTHTITDNVHSYHVPLGGRRGGGQKGGREREEERGKEGRMGEEKERRSEGKS